MVSTKDSAGSALERLREFGLRYPGAHTKSPWPGHLDLAVNDKTFAYLSIAGEPLKISCKLPRSADAALELPFTTPTAYGLGKSGWVTATFPDDGTGVPVDLLEEWIDESYRAQAPKRLSAGLPAFGTAVSAERSTVKRKVASARAAAKPAKANGTREGKGEGKRAKRAAAPVAKAAAGSKRRSAKRSASSVTARAARSPAARSSAARSAASKSPAAMNASASGARSASSSKRSGVTRRASKRPATNRAG